MKKNHRSLWLPACALVLGSIPALLAAQSTYHVDPVAGNDGFPGTQDEPFATIGRAVQESNNNPAPAGERNTILVEAGSYTVSSTITVSQPVDILGPQAGVDPRPSAGTTRTVNIPLSPQVLPWEFENPENEAILSANNANHSILSVQSSDVTVDGLAFFFTNADVITTRKPSAGDNHTGIVFRNIVVGNSGDDGMDLRGADGLVVENSYFFRLPNAAIKIRGTEDGIDDRMNGTIIRNNDVDYTTWLTGSPSWGALYVLEGANNTSFVGNNQSRSISQGGIVFNNDDYPDNVGGLAYGNTISNNGQGGITVNMSNTRVIANNITAINDDGGIYLRTRLAPTCLENIVIAHNVIFDVNYSQSSTTKSGGINFSTPCVDIDTLEIFGNSLTNLQPNAIASGDKNIEIPGNWFGSNDGPNETAEVVGDADPTDWLTEAPDADSRPAAFDPESLDFGTIAIDATEELTATLTHAGDLLDSGLLLDGVLIEITGSGAEKFSVVSGPATPAALAAGESVEFTFQFDPAGDFGTFNAVATLVGGNESNGPISIALTGATPGPPEVTTNNTLHVIRGRRGVIWSGFLEATDSDQGPDELEFTVTDGPANGSLNLTTFTQEDLANGLVVYTHNGSDESDEDSFEFSVDDNSEGATDGTFEIMIWDRWPDADGDGVPDALEAFLGTDPNNRDTSGDGFEDGVLLALGLDPLNDHTGELFDSSANGVPDPFDQSGEIDADGDGYPDFYEIAVGTDPNDADDQPELGKATGNEAGPDIADVLEIFRVFLGAKELSEVENPNVLDISRDGSITNLDGTILVNFVVGNIPVIPSVTPGPAPEIIFLED